MKRISLAGLAFVMLFVWTSTVQAQSPQVTGRDDRFIAYDNGTVLDTWTNLMWAAHNNVSGLNWYNAKSYCENYRGGGYTDWRMPTPEELMGLYDAAKSYTSNYGVVLHLTELIHLTCHAFWTLQTGGSLGRVFSFGDGGWRWNTQSDNSTLVLPVRSAK